MSLLVFPNQRQAACKYGHSKILHQTASNVQVLHLLRNFAKPCLDMKHDQTGSASMGKHLLLLLEAEVSHFTMQAPKVCNTTASKATACMSLVIMVRELCAQLANGKSRSR